MIEDFIHLPSVSTTPVVHIELRVSPRIFEKFEMALMIYIGAWLKLIHEKNQKSKNSWYCPFKFRVMQEAKIDACTVCSVHLRYQYHL
jgi:hypothetical protein